MSHLRFPLAAWFFIAASGLLLGCPSDGHECTTDHDCGADKPHCGLLRTCVECFVSEHCDDGVYCNGAERCVSQACRSGSPIACTGGSCGAACDEGLRACVSVNPDADADGSRSISCGGDDCDDADPDRYPGNAEVCDPDAHDEDCDPMTYGFRDADGDGAPDATCCNPDWDGRRVCGDDCDDARRGVHPSAPEVCNMIDDDCDGAVDEGVIVGQYRDDDGDGWGTGRTPRDVCAGEPGWANLPGDCDDANPQLHPGAFRCAGSGADIDVCYGPPGGGWIGDTCPGGGMCVAQPDGTGVCLEGATPQCSDGTDDDRDGFIDAYDPNCSSPLDDSEAPTRCADGDDNDSDGAIDYPDDPGCASPEDTSEADPATEPACANGLDDDGDGTQDWLGGTGDPGCVAASDDDERQADGPQCDNGIDDDGDLGIDCCAKLTGDAQCTGPADVSEGPPACSNGIDDDGDGFTDFSSDSGCANTSDESERNPAGAQCDNGLDDDGDGASDFPGDSLCADAQDNDEAM